MWKWLKNLFKPKTTKCRSCKFRHGRYCGRAFVATKSDVYSRHYRSIHGNKIVRTSPIWCPIRKSVK